MTTLKKLLIPLAHAFILLPIAAMVAGSPAMGTLFALFALLLVPSVIGWAADALLPDEFPVVITGALLLVLGVFCGFVFLPQLAFSAAGISVDVNSTNRLQYAVLFGVIAGIVMIWSMVACRRGMQKGLAPFKFGVGMVLYIVTYFTYRGQGSYVDSEMNDLFQPIFLFGAVWMVFSVVAINSSFIERMARSKTQRRAPQAVRWYNVLFSVLMAAVILLASSFGALRKWLTQAVLRLFDAFAEMIQNSQITPGGPSQQVDMLEGLDAEVHVVSETSRRITSVVVVVLSAAILIFLLYIIGKKLLEAVRQLRITWQGRIRRLQDEPLYEEEEEELDHDSMRDELQNRLAMGRHRRRDRFEDMPDDRSRVRWLYRRLRDAMIRKKTYDATRTPAETGRNIFAAQPAVGQLLEDYAEVRYSDHEPDEQAVERGRAALKGMH